MFRESGWRAKIRGVDQFSSQYSAITVLRLLAWLDTDRRYRDLVLDMEDHDQEQCSPLPLVELQRGSALIGQMLQSVSCACNLMP